MSDELKPCPFCGSDKVAVSHTPHSKYGILYGVECKSCNAHDNDRFIFEHYAIRSWNSRPAEESLRKQLEDLLYFLRFVAEDVECNSMPGLAYRIDEEIKKHEQKGER